MHIMLTKNEDELRCFEMICDEINHRKVKVTIEQDCIDKHNHCESKDTNSQVRITGKYSMIEKKTCQKSRVKMQFSK